MKDLSFVGVGGATCLELGGNCCFLKGKDELLVIDICECATEKLLKAGAFDGVKEIYIAITHTHYDHIAGLGTLIWYCNFYLNISPKIIYSNCRYAMTLKKLLKLTGVSKKFYGLVKDKDFDLEGLKLSYKKTEHEPTLQCHGIMFEDKEGKYYYTGDSRDIGFVKTLTKEGDVKKIYCEVCTESYGVHIAYDELLKIKCDKIIPMHFNTLELYNRAQNDGFNMPKFLN